MLCQFVLDSVEMASIVNIDEEWDNVVLQVHTFLEVLAEWGEDTRTLSRLEP